MKRRIFMKIKIVSWNVDENFDKKVLAKLPTEIEVPKAEISSETLNDDIHDFINDVVGVVAYEYEIFPTRKNAEELWEIFGDVNVNDNDEIETDWFRFDAGTNKIDIWKWFEEYFHVSVAKDLM